MLGTAPIEFVLCFTTNSLVVVVPRSPLLARELRFRFRALESGCAVVEGFLMGRRSDNF